MRSTATAGDCTLRTDAMVCGTPADHAAGGVGAGGDRVDIFEAGKENGDKLLGSMVTLSTAKAWNPGDGGIGVKYKSHPHYDRSDALDWLYLRPEDWTELEPGPEKSLHDLLRADKSWLCDLALSQMVGRTLPILSVFVPLYLVVLMAGWKKGLEVWPACLVSGGSFAIA